MRVRSAQIRARGSTHRAATAPVDHEARAPCGCAGDSAAGEALLPAVGNGVGKTSAVVRRSGVGGVGRRRLALPLGTRLRRGGGGGGGRRNRARAPEAREVGLRVDKAPRGHVLRGRLGFGARPTEEPRSAPLVLIVLQRRFGVRWRETLHRVAQRILVALIDNDGDGRLRRLVPLAVALARRLLSTRGGG